MHWTIAALWVDHTNINESKWIHDFVQQPCPHEFTLIPRSKPMPNWHTQKSSVTSFNEWKIHWAHAKDAIQSSKGGLITVFPQLPVLAGMQNKLSRKKMPILSYLFNVGTIPNGAKKYISKWALSEVDRFIVHTSREVELYSEWLDLPRDKFQFFPRQGGKIAITHKEDLEQPFILAMGSAHRDYKTFFSAIKKLDLPTVVIASPRVLEGLDIPKNVTIKNGLTPQECFEYTQRARLNITPLQANDNVTAAGQITIVNTMNMGKMLISTDCNGANDYIKHNETGFLIKPNSEQGISESIDLLWHDEALRNQLNTNAKNYADKYYSDEAAADNLVKTLSELEADYS